MWYVDLPFDEICMFFGIAHFFCTRRCRFGLFCSLFGMLLLYKSCALSRCFDVRHEAHRPPCLLLFKHPHSSQYDCADCVTHVLCWISATCCPSLLLLSQFVVFGSPFVVVVLLPVPSQLHAPPPVCAALMFPACVAASFAVIGIWYCLACRGSPWYCS